MKKIIAVLVSISLLVLNATPALAQATLGKGVLTRKTFATPNIKVPAGNLPTAGKISAEASPALGAAIERAALQNMRLPLTQNYAALLGNRNPLVTPARQILAHPNAKERALLLRSDFTALALHHQTAQADVERALSFYRDNLLKDNRTDAVNTVADIASLGLFGTAQKEADLILKTANKPFKTDAQQAAVTAAAARALLRLGAYEAVEKLAAASTLQPELWEGIAAYAKVFKLPVEIPTAQVRKEVDITAVQQALDPLGPLNKIAAGPSLQATCLYMNAGRENDGAITLAPAIAAKIQPLQETPTALAPIKIRPIEELSLKIQPLQAPTPTPAGENLTQAAAVQPAADESLVVAPTQTAALAMAQKAAETPLLNAQTKQWLKQFKPKGITSADETKFAQRAALYLTAFSIGLEIGTPIMASIKTALQLPLSLAVLITAATYAPYLFGSFIANWLKKKVGRKGTVNLGLGLMGGSFALGATALGLDGSFTAWDNQLAQFYSILGALTTASTGAVFIHSSVGPVMTEISHKANELVRQKRGTYVELSRSIGMMASFAFPFIATSMLGLDWSAPFLLALPIVGASALTLNLAKLPNTKPHLKLNAELKTAQAPVMDGVRKARKAMAWKTTLFNNEYVRLLREEPGVGSFISALFIMNAVEMGINSGFLFMVPQLTDSESLKYLLGMAQFAVPFLLGRYLAGHFLKWFPKRSISVATLLGGVSALASLGLTDNIYAFTAALFTAELGISTAFTLSYARTAVKPSTQDRITSLIMATAVACAVGPVILTEIAEAFMSAGITEGGATIAALIAIPSALALFSTALFRRMENKTVPGLKMGVKRWKAKIRRFFK